MKIKSVVQLAILMVGTSQLRAETVEKYLADRSSHDYLVAQLEVIYYRGFGNGIMVANTQLFIESIKSGSPTMLFCFGDGSPDFASILDDEIKRRVALAAGNPVEVKKLMETDTISVLMNGLKRAFACSSDSIQQALKNLREQLGQHVSPADKQP